MKKVYCRKDLIYLNEILFHEGKVYNVLSYEKITNGIADNERINVEGENKRKVHFVNYFDEYFISIKEIRKMKLQKIYENG